jgi:hypothetical protein
MVYTVSGFGLKNKSLVVGRAVRALGARAKANARTACPTYAEQSLSIHIYDSPRKIGISSQTSGH